MCRKAAMNSVSQFFLAHLEVGVVGRDVVAAVDDMVAAIMGFVDVVGVFDECQERDVVLAFVGRIGREC